MVGYDVTWLVIQVLFSMLQSMLTNVMSRGLRTSAVSNSCSSCWHGLLWNRVYLGFEDFAWNSGIVYNLLPGLWAISVPSAEAYWGRGGGSHWRGKLNEDVNESMHDTRRSHSQFTMTGECVLRWTWKSSPFNWRTAEEVADAADVKRSAAAQEPHISLVDANKNP